MPAKRKSRKKKTISLSWKRLAGRALISIAGLLLAASVTMLVNASLVRLHTAEVYLADLPESFDGTKILYLTDIHVDMFNTPNRVYGLIRQLMAAEPDMVLLGGDYASFGLGEMVLSIGGEEASAAVRSRERDRVDELFSFFAETTVPLGIYAVTGESDRGFGMGGESAVLGNVRFLNNRAQRVERNGESIVIAGLEEWTTGRQDIRAVADAACEGDCVVLISNNADVFPMLNAEPASGGGRFYDLVLSGRTHGGQIVLFGRAALENSIYAGRYRTGWFSENGAHLLVSNGIGGNILPMRFGAPPEAHLLMLKKKN